MPAATSLVVDLLGRGSRARGRAACVALVVAAVAVPVLLLLAFGSAANGGSALLGLVLGLVLDLLVAVLLVAYLSHRMTTRRLARLARSVEALERRARTDRLEQLVDRQAKTLRQLGENLRRQSDETTRVRRDLVAVGDRLQATENLFALVPPRGTVPPLVGYVASPDVLLLLVSRLLAVRPGLVVECGSGTSTLFLALAVQQHGLDCRVVSLENDAGYAAGTRALLAEHGVAHLAEVRHAPLVPTSIEGYDGPWYEPAAYEDLHGIGLAFVDGPPGNFGPSVRYPAVPLLADRLAPTCALVLDDANRPDERDVAQRWSSELDGFTYVQLPLTRGAALFTRDA